MWRVVSVFRRGKRFFFEKKKQKTFDRWAWRLQQSGRHREKVFASLLCLREKPKNMALITRQGKALFSEEKKQKTFVQLSRFHPDGAIAEPKVFWFFFSKKNTLLFSADDAIEVFFQKEALPCLRA